MATHSSILAWKILWTEEPSGLQSMELQRVGHDQAYACTHTHTHTHTHTPFWKYVLTDQDVTNMEEAGGKRQSNGGKNKKIGKSNSLQREA